MTVALTPQFTRQYRSLAAPEQLLCDSAVENLPTTFGHPHLHAGLGLRALRRGVYECRVSQSVRIGFTRHGDTLLLQTIGNHDAIRTWLRNNI